MCKKEIIGEKATAVQPGFFSLEEKVVWKSQAAFQYLKGAYREARKGVWQELQWQDKE